MFTVAFYPELSDQLSSINVEGIESAIPLPISLDNIQLLKSKATKAPFGKGTATVLDTNVRDAWQIDGSSVWSNSNPAFFPHSIHKIARSTLKEFLGIDSEAVGIGLTLYKMLIYEEGGHFLAHCDTEKEPGMFATYLLQLPVEGGHEGGELIVNHASKCKRFITAADSHNSKHETIFYADCEHELRPVTKGWRCVLAFNLIWRVGMDDSSTVSIPMLVPVSHTKSLVGPIEELIKFIDHWEKAGTAHHSMLAIPLEHKYTETNIAFSGLKGNDSLVAQIIMKLSGKMRVFLWMRMLTALEYDGTDMCDRNFESKWVNAQDKVIAGYEIHVKDIVGSNIANEDTLFENIEPDETEEQEYTGNEGPAVAYKYRKAFLVLIPIKFHEEVQVRDNFQEFIYELLTQQVTINASENNNIVFIKNPSEVSRRLDIIRKHQNRVDKKHFLTFAVICEARNDTQLRDSFLQSFLLSSDLKFDNDHFACWAYLIRQMGWKTVCTRFFTKFWTFTIDMEIFLLFVTKLSEIGDAAASEEVFQWIVSSFFTIPANKRRPLAPRYGREFSLKLLEVLFKRSEHVEEVIDYLSREIDQQNTYLLQSFINEHLQSTYSSGNIAIRERLRNLVTRRNQALQIALQNANQNSSWAVPILDDYDVPEELLKFFQSEERELTIKGMQNRQDARNYARKYIDHYATPGLSYTEGSTYVHVIKQNRNFIDRQKRTLTQLIVDTERVLSAIISFPELIDNSSG